MLAPVQKFEDLGVLLHLELLFDLVSDEGEKALLTIIEEGPVENLGLGCCRGRHTGTPSILIQLVALLWELD